MWVWVWVSVSVTVLNVHSGMDILLPECLVSIVFVVHSLSRRSWLWLGAGDGAAATAIGGAHCTRNYLVPIASKSY